jgi:hypothetical protein
MSKTTIRIISWILAGLMLLGVVGAIIGITAS